MGKTTAGLPLRPGEHYERCPAAGCGTVYRTKRDTRFRCPTCHRLAYAIATPDGEPGRRRHLEGADGTVYRVIERRPAEGEKPPAFAEDVVLFLEAPDDDGPIVAPPPSTVPGVPAPPPPAPGRPRASVLGFLARAWRGGDD